MTEIWAGFECARFEKWGHQDLLEETRHTPQTDMVEHYGVVKAHGVTTVRDGLPFHKSIPDRLNAVPEGMKVWWDLVHFDPSPYLRDHVNQVKRLADATRGPLYLCPVNEPSSWDILTPHNQAGAIGLAGDLIRWCRDQIEQVEFMTCDPVHHFDPAQLYATHKLCEVGIDLIGINYYPHETQIPLREILQWIRQEFPHHRLAVTETSYHTGWEPVRHNWPHIRSQAGWLLSMINEIAASGVVVEGLCWYPWIDMPGWGEKRHEVWPSGMVDLHR